MDVKNIFLSLIRSSFCVREALSDQVRRAAPEDRPALDRLSEHTVFAVFETLPNQLELFLGLVTAEQVVAYPGRVLGDLLLKPAPPALSPTTPVEVAKRRLEDERLGALPVLDEDGRFVGAVTLLSLLEAAVRQEAMLRREGLELLEQCRRECERLEEYVGHLKGLQAASKRLLQEVVHTKPEREVLQHGIELLSQWIRARYGAIVVLDEAGEIRDFVYCGLDRETASRIGRLPQGTGLLGEKALGKMGTLRLENLEDHPHASGFPEGHPVMRQLVAALIEHQGRTFGRVYLCDRIDGAPFSAEDELEVKEFAAMLALGIENSRQRQQIDTQLKLAAKVFESSTEGILVTDASTRILMVNQALTTITGYKQEELIGKTPKIFQSGHHGEEFYRKMWHELIETGQWQGEIWNQRKNGSVYPEWLKISALTDENGQVTHYVAVFSDLSLPTSQRKNLERLVHFDHLTDLPDRLRFRAELGQAMLRTRFNGKSVALLMLDLDRFKTINDAFGHQVGDCLLQQVAKRMQHCVRKREAQRIGDTVARLGGDEFGIILNDLECPEDAEGVARKILERFQQPFLLGKLERSVTASIGIAIYPGDAETLDELIRCADLAMYQAKKLRRNHCCRYDDGIHIASKHRLRLENDLYHALDRRAFEIHYQPQLALETSRVVGLEALLRWRHPEYGSVSPQEFIPILEEIGLIEQIGEWVLHRVCACYLECRQRLGLEEGALTVAINVSAHQLNAHLIPQVRAALEENRLDPRCLKLELIESVAMDNLQSAREIFTELKALGVGICIDDFGTGYSSLSYLTRLPITALKIDRSFVQGMSSNPDDHAVVSSIIALAHNLGLEVIAEGVETYEQYTLLCDLGCDIMQGYLVGQPLPLEALKPPAFPSPG